MKENKNNNLQNSLIVVPEKENVITKFVKWIKNIFGKNERKMIGEESVVTQCPNITIPKAVKATVPIAETIEPDENNLEYLYQLSDEQLDDLSSLYDQQMEDAQKEVLKLDHIIETYKQSIKKLQGQITSEEN